MASTIKDYESLGAELAARQGSLSRRLEQVARFFLNHPEEVAISTLVTLANHAQVPPATITRFAKELGFAGFAELQAVFRERLVGPRAPYAERVSKLRQGNGAAEIADADLQDSGRMFEGFVQAAVNSLVRIEESLDRSELAAFVDALAACDAVHVAAARGAFSIGAYSVYGLANVGKRAHLVDNLGAMRAEQIGAMGPNDLLLAVTFDDYTPETVEAAKLAAARGRTVLAITDNELSPVVGVASHVLYVTEARLGHFRSQVPALVVCQAIIVSLGRRLGEGAPSPKMKIKNQKQKNEK
ncbi:MurR/RpiR family transcriptional regulator [Devosia lacusdianchii]|uniref:MurR/RpiR family transcriptional regulator n=1 Tax=Devosia lacusdianchii TaxID=2917991 RepID=UPI001F05E3BC|nr:MurR/RpiR family transcriptional regulator [Devosia sp. JXJ CY 41]